jgi:hypothetical protein
MLGDGLGFGISCRKTKLIAKKAMSASKLDRMEPVNPSM